MYKKILVPLDGSELSERAVPHALEIARRFEGKLVLLRCLLPPDPFLMQATLSFPTYYGEIQRIELTDTQTYLGQLRDRPELAPYVEAVQSPCGAPAEEILEYASRENCDLIVMSSHGRSGLGRFVFGSVAEKVVRHSPTPVLVIGPDRRGPSPSAPTP